MKRRYIYALSFILPLITLICGMIYFGVAPFGDHSLLIIDGLHQYIPFYSVLYDKLRSGESLFYTFRTGLGINFLSLFAYYLSSPLNLIIVFFSRDSLSMVVSWLIVIKLSLSGLCAGIYFTSRSNKPGLAVVAVSTAYALNGYMVGYCWNVMWLDAIMILPLVVLGIDRLIEKKDGRLYCLALFYALYCNYYIAFMICIFSVIWYLLHHFSSVKQFFFRGIAFTVYSFLAAGMAAVLLIPAYMGIRQTSSGSEMVLPVHSWITGFWDLISRQFDMAYPISHDNFDGNANLYFGIFAILFIVLYLLNRRISLLEKCKAVLLIVFFYLSFNEQILNFIWHGFHDQYGIPNRFAFLYGFVLLYMVYEVLERLDGIRIWEPILALVHSLGLLAGVYYYAETELATEVICSAVFLLIVYGLILFLQKKDSKRCEFYRILLLAVMTGELMVTSLLGFDTNGQISISKFFYATDDMVQAIEEHDDGTFYRSELAEGAIVDESTWYPMKAVSLFGSTARSEVVDIMDSLGFSTGCNEYLYKGATPVTNLMFGVRYLYYHEDDAMVTDFNYLGDYGSMSLYENPVQGLSVGYGISEDIDDWYYYSDYPFRVLNDFCYQGYGIDEIYEDIPITDPVTNSCEVTPTNDGEYYFELDSVQIDNLTFTLDLPDGAQSLYLFYDGTQVETASVAIDGYGVESGDFDGRMLPIGSVSPGSHVTITMELKGEQSTGYIRLSAADFDQSLYQELVEDMTSQAFQVTDYTNDHIEGEITVPEEEYVYFSIPYDEGWSVTVDGKNEEIYDVGCAFLAVLVSEGEHTITLDYTPEGFLPGLLITIVSLICFILLCILTGRRRKKDKLAEIDAVACEPESGMTDEAKDTDEDRET